MGARRAFAIKNNTTGPVLCGEDTGEDYALWGVRDQSKALLQEHGIQESNAPKKPMTSFGRSTYGFSAPNVNEDYNAVGAGGLVECLTMFAEHNVKVTRVVTQWKEDGYFYFVDVDGSPATN